MEQDREPRSAPSDTTGTATYYTAGRRAGRRRPRGPRGSSSRLRMVFFIMASLWGFMVGAGLIAPALFAGGKPLASRPLVAVLLLSGVLLAGFGGALASMVYRRVRDRGVARTAATAPPRSHPEHPVLEDAP